MENYHKRAKTSKPKFEDDIQDATTASKKHQQQQKQTTQQHNRPQQHGVMAITPNGKIRTYVSRALEVLTEADSTPVVAAAGAGSVEGTEGAESKRSDNKGGAATSHSIPSISSSKHPTPRGVLTLKAQGKSITKAVTVAEILKRRMEGVLHQFTEIGQVTEREIWDPNPDQPNLDPITVSKHRPTIRIRLSKHLDETTTGSTGSGDGIDMTMPGANIPREEHADEEESDEDDDEDGQAETWPGAILDRDAAARRFVGYQAPTGNDIYL
ncbi:hypothetical protein KI688_009994 [Linnemannia hyalina]|uniref:DNA/RNA-binding protein Alba-like domain-containing protein n=1 Tax=Linnemannia hyalina TaxID=64524 RepID=A0A9P8BU89_9FUNG|nr:hypothetical protein KI688_009994 [Linnemannia hyalina]